MLLLYIFIINIGLGVLLVSWVMQLSAMVIWYYATTPGIYYFLAVWVGISGAAHIVGLSHAPKQVGLYLFIPVCFSLLLPLCVMCNIDYC